MWSRILLQRIGTAARYFSKKTNEEIEKLVKNNKVVVFMKGVPEQPQCGFSNAVVQILRMHGISYDAHNVLKDENLRQGIICSYIFITAIFIYRAATISATQAYISSFIERGFTICTEFSRPMK